MDNVIRVRRSFLNELRGFCNRFASMCDGCFRSPCDCPLADSIRLSKNLIFRIDNIRDAEEERYFVENPQLEKCAKVVRAIEQAGRPLLACEIRLHDTDKYHRQKKHQLLSSMVGRGEIVSFVRNGRTYFNLPEIGKINTNTHTKENAYGIQP